MSAITQGVTLEVIGNCGFGCAPIARSAARPRSAIYGFDDSIPLTWHEHRRLSRKAGGRAARGQCDDAGAERPAAARDARPRRARRRNADEIARRCERLLEESLDRGRLGLLDRPRIPGGARRVRGRTDRACARDGARRGGFYATHTRDRDAGAPRGGRGGDPHRAQRRGRSCRSSHLIPRSGDARRACAASRWSRRRARRGQDIAFDMHTRLYGTTMLSTLLPPWALAERSDRQRRSAARPGDADAASRPTRASSARRRLGHASCCSTTRSARVARARPRRDRGRARRRTPIDAISTSSPTMPRHCSGRW